MNARNLFLALLMVITAISAACGDDDGAGLVATPSPSPGAAAASSPATQQFPVTITDDRGVAVTLDAEPTRIVALAPSFVEILFAVGAGNTIVAADQNTDYPPEAASIPKISGFEPSVEGIAAFEPDLVLMLFDPGGLQDALQGIGVNTLFLASPASVEDTFTQISTLGLAVGRTAAGQELVGGMQVGIDDIGAKLPAGRPGPRIYHEVDSTYYTAGPGSFIDDLYTILGAQNIAESTGQAFPQLSAEAIIAADPEVIILADELAGESAETVAARPGWSQISAVRNARVHLLDPNIVSRPGPRLVDALDMMVRLLYPEAF